MSATTSSKRASAERMTRQQRMDFYVELDEFFQHGNVGTVSELCARFDKTKVQVRKCAHLLVKEGVLRVGRTVCTTRAQHDAAGVQSFYFTASICQEDVTRELLARGRQFVKGFVFDVAEPPPKVCVVQAALAAQTPLERAFCGSCNPPAPCAVWSEPC
jgi:hypothetical protein